MAVNLWATARDEHGEASEEARLAMGAQRNKPWTRSTGPTTPEGKARTSQNARKHNERAAETLQMRHEIRDLLSKVRAVER